MAKNKFRLAKQHDGKYAVQKKGFFGWRTLRKDCGDYSYSLHLSYEDAVDYVNKLNEADEEWQRIRNHTVTYIYPPFPDEEPNDNREGNLQQPAQ